MHRRALIKGSVLAVVACSCFWIAHTRPAAAQEPPKPGPQRTIEPMTDDNMGFVSIFDGKTLHDWDGDPVYWRVENGAITGETTAATIPKHNSFIVWKGGKTADFELKVDYRITEHGNSGVNYRSIELPGFPWVMEGYQADIDGAHFTNNGVRYTGQNYEERGRTFLALRGQFTHIGEDQKPRVAASIGDTVEMEKFVHNNDWNRYDIVARGNVLIHILNGHVMCMVIDDDPQGRRMEGDLGMQVHVGPPMKVEFKNILLKKL